MSDKPITGGQIIGEKDIYPPRSAKNGFINTVAVALGDFLQNAYQFVLARLIEQQRRDEGVKQLYDYFDQHLNGHKDPSIRAQRQADLMSVLSNYINRTNRSIDKDFAAKALAELFSSLDSVSVVPNQEENRKKTILASLKNVSTYAWKDAIFSIAVRTTTFANAKEPLELKVALVVDESTAMESYAKVSKISLYTLAMDVIKKWISNAKLTYTTISGKSLAQKASSSNGQDTNVLFVHIVMHIFSSPENLQATLKTAVSHVLASYVDLYVVESPSAGNEVKIAQNDYILKFKHIRERAIRKSQAEHLTIEAKLALEYGMSATSLIQLAHEKGYYYGANRQLHMFQAYEGKMKDIAMERACKSVLQKVGEENSHMQSTLLSEMNRIMWQNKDNGSLQQQYQLQAYEQQQRAALAGIASSQLPQAAPSMPFQSMPFQNQNQNQNQPMPNPNPSNQGPPPFVSQQSFPFNLTQSHPHQSNTNHQSNPNQYQSTPNQSSYPSSNAGYGYQQNYQTPNNTSSFVPPTSHPPHGNQHMGSNRHVSFAGSTHPSNHSGNAKSYASPPPSFQYKPNTNGYTAQGTFKPSPMTQNTSKRGPKPVYEDSSGDEDSDNSSMSGSESSGSGFEESSDSDF